MSVVALLFTLQAAVPTLDGAIGPGEYDGGTSFTGSGGLVVRIRTTDDAVYIAASGAAGGYPHVAISRGDTVLLLHASAALATARFAGPTDMKAQVHGFTTFSVRNAGTSAAGDAAREAFYRREGWTATTVEMGTPGVTEFKVAQSLLPGGTPSVVAFWSESGGVQRWPAEVEDDAVAVRVVQGWLTTTARFAVVSWGRMP
jgi:hypothetical protein